MSPFDIQEHSPWIRSDIAFSVTEEIRESVSYSVSDSIGAARSIIDEYSRIKITGEKLSSEIGARKNIFGISIGAKLGGELIWERHISNRTATGFEETTSLTQTEGRITERARTTMQSRTFFLTSEMPAGYYRYSMFFSSDVYLYVIRDSLTHEIVHFEFMEYVRPGFIHGI
jgi:hypothetical protein